MKGKRRYIIFLLFFMLHSSFLGWGQCPFGNNSRLECVYGCDNFTDADGDGYCDYSRILTKETPKTDTITPKTSKTVTPSKPKTENAKPALPGSSQSIEKEKDTISDILPDETMATEEELPVIAKTSFKKPYRLILISALTLGFYFFTFLLTRIGILHKTYHRRIWNTLLLLTAIISCLFGFFLIIQLNYGILSQWYRPILTWHVECGIAMVIISVFHVIWHIPYYKRLFKKAGEK